MLHRTERGPRPDEAGIVSEEAKVVVRDLAA